MGVLVSFPGAGIKHSDKRKLRERLGRAAELEASVKTASGAVRASGAHCSPPSPHSHSPGSHPEDGSAHSGYRYSLLNCNQDSSPQTCPESYLQGDSRFYQDDHTKYHGG